jgi:hypothetical protein
MALFVQPFCRKVYSLLTLAFDLWIQTFGNQRMLTKLDAEKQIYRCHDMKLLLLLQKDYDLCWQTPMSMSDLDRNLRLEYEWLQFVSLTNEVLDVATVSCIRTYYVNRLATSYCCMLCMQKHKSVRFLMSARC